MIPVELSDERLLLRAPTLDDVDAIAVICRDPEITRWIGAIPLNYTTDDARWFVTEMADRGWEAGTDLVWLITAADGGEVLGNIGLHLRSPGVAEIGFLLAEPARGNGYMTDAVTLVCEYGFGALALDRIEWQAAVGNHASRAVAQRSGFIFEGVLRARLQTHDGSGTGERRAADAWIAAKVSASSRERDSGQPVVELQVGGVRLRPWRATDRDDLVAACQDEVVQRWTLVPRPYTVAHAEEFLASRAPAWLAGLPSFAITDLASGRLLGSIGVVDLDAEEGPAVGYWLAAWARGHGHGTSALRAICRWLLDEGAPRIRWDAEVGNIASLRTAEAVGFVVEAVNRRAFVHHGQRADKWSGSLLPGDFRDGSQTEAPNSRVPRDWPVTPVRLSNERVTLRGFEDSDVSWLLDLPKDAETMQWNPSRLRSPDDLLERVRGWSHWSDGSSASWVIMRDDQTPVGTVSIHSISTEHANAEIGYDVLATHRGHGYATAAVGLVTSWVFESLPIARVQLVHGAGNVASCKVAEAAGFPLEGTLRRSYRYGDGQLHDEHIHARLVDD